MEIKDVFDALYLLDSGETITIEDSIDGRIQNVDILKIGYNEYQFQDTFEILNEDILIEYISGKRLFDLS